MNILQILMKITALFLIMAVGYIANKVGVMNTDSTRTLSKLVINITLPAYVLGSAMSNASASAGSVFLMLGLSFGHYLLVFLLAWLLPKLLRVPQEQIGTFRFMMCFANVGFIGYPVVSAVLGAEAIFPATIFNLPFNLLSYTVGVVMVSSRQGVKLNAKLLLTAPAISGVIGIIIALTPLQYPTLLIDTCEMLGAITTPAALLIIGSTLAGMPMRQLIGDWRMYAMCLFRLAAMPLLMWTILRPFVTDPYILGVCVLLSGMPVATNGTMICLTYGGDQKMVSQGTFLTTLLNLVTIPLMALLLQV